VESGRRVCRVWCLDAVCGCGGWTQDVEEGAAGTDTDGRGWQGPSRGSGRADGWPVQGVRGCEMQHGGLQHCCCMLGQPGHPCLVRRMQRHAHTLQGGREQGVSPPAPSRSRPYRLQTIKQYTYTHRGCGPAAPQPRQPLPQPLQQHAPPMRKARCVCVFVCVCVRAHKCERAHSHVHVRACMRACMCMCVCACV